MEVIEQRRKKIGNSFRKKFGSPKILRSKHLQFLFNEYNREFLNDKIQQPIKFRTKSISPFMAAYTEVTFTNENQNEKYTVVIDSYLLDNADFTRSTVGYLKCSDKIECLQLLFEHELVHLLFYLQGEQYHVNGHNKRFSQTLKKIFGHNSYTTSIVNNIIKRVGTQTTLKKNDQVWIRSPNNTKLEFMGVIKDIINKVYLVESYTGEELALDKDNILFYFR